MYPSTETMKVFARFLMKSDRHPYVLYEANDPRIVVEDSLLTKLLKKLRNAT